MIRTYFSACFFFFAGFLLQGQEIGQWTDHLSYNNAVAVTNGNEFIYCGTKSAIFKYHKQHKYINRVSKANGLSDVGISTLKYHPDKDLLLIAYVNTNIDLLMDDEVINISDVFRFNALGVKRINDIYFKDNLAYLSCSFGIVVVDLDKLEIKDTYKIGPVSGEEINITSVTIHDSFIYAASEIGLHRAPLDGTNLLNYQNWDVVTTNSSLPDQEAHYVATFEGNVFASIEDTVYRFHNDSWAAFYHDGLEAVYISKATEEMILTSVSDSGTVSHIVRLKADGNAEILLDGMMNMPQQAIEDEKGELWVADLIRGLINHKESNTEYIVPNGPFSMDVHDIYVQDKLVYVASGGMTSNFKESYNTSGIYIFDGFSWQNINIYNNPAFSEYRDIIRILTDPSGEKIYMASYLDGLGILEAGNLTIYAAANSPLEHAPSVPNVTHVNDIALGADGALWMVNFGASKSLKVLTAEGQWHSFSIGSGFGHRLLIDDFGQKWAVLTRDGNNALAVFDEGEDLDNTSDDRYVLLNVSNEAIHTNGAWCIAKDRDGEIWVGTEEGISVFYCPGSVLDNQCPGRRIFVEQDSVTAYLFQNEKINTITVDGANRKWIGTPNGAWLMSEDGTEEILHFNESNSPLFSNNVKDIAVDHKTGLVYFATDNGIIAYKGTATEGKPDFSNVKIYPNPVREDYEGLIAIKGLTEDASVKITDISGQLIFETRANGGQAIWDAKNYNGRRANTGVYLVFSTSGDGVEKFVGKLLLIN